MYNVQQQIHSLSNCAYQFHICGQLLPTRKDTQQCAGDWCHTTVLWVFRLMSQWHRDDGSVLQNLDFPTLSLPISSILTSVWHTLQFLCHSTQQQPTQHSLYWMNFSQSKNCLSAAELLVWTQISDSNIPRKSLSFVVATNGVPAGLPEIFVIRSGTGLHQQITPLLLWHNQLPALPRYTVMTRRKTAQI